VIIIFEEKLKLLKLFDWNKKTLVKINVAHEFYFLKIIEQQLAIIQNRAFFEF